MPVAGKTRTPENWSDAWAVGYSPYYTTAVWFGFDKPGNSLGVDLTGSTLAGPVWGDYMREIHRGLPRKDFTRPSSGIIDVSVCAKSGLLRTAVCNEGEVTLPFMVGTQPGRYCDMHTGSSPYDVKIPISTTQFGSFGDNEFINSLRMPTLSFDQLPELADTFNDNYRRSGNRNSSTTSSNRNTQQSSQMFSNPLLDDDEYAERNFTFESDEPHNPALYNDMFYNEQPSWNPLE
jgi:penicillin-binding protein 1A